MPAKIRTIRGLRGGNFKGVATDWLIDFDKSLDPTGGTMGLLSYKEGRRRTRIRLYQDKNEDGKFSKRELIYKGKTSEASYDELTYVKEGLIKRPTVKLRKQMHSCTWDALKGNKVEFCTADYVPTVYTLTLKLEGGGKVTPEGVGDFFDHQLMVSVKSDDPSPLYEL